MRGLVMRAQGVRSLDFRGLVSPGVALGFVGTGMLAVSACSNVFSHSPQGWPLAAVRAIGELVHPLVIALLLLAGSFTLFAGWWMVRPRAGRADAPSGVVLAVWSLPLLLVPPLLSGDAFIYADLGWSVHLGTNPYIVGIGGMGGPYLPQLDSLWVGYGAPYPALILQVHRFAAEMFGFHPYWGVIAQRVPALAGMALVVAFLPRLATYAGASARWANWFGVLNPLLIIECVGGAHNDSLMVGVVVLGLWISTRGLRRVSASLFVGPAVIGLAMCLKQQAGLAVVAAAGLPIAAQLARLPLPARLLRLGGRSFIATLVSVTTFTLASLATGLGFGWVEWLWVMGRATTLVSPLVESIGAGPIVSVAVPGLSAAGLVLLLIAKAHQPLHFTAWGSLLVPFLGQAWQPWYLTLGLVLLGGLPVSRAVAGALLLDPDLAAGRLGPQYSVNSYWGSAAGRLPPTGSSPPNHLEPAP